MDIQSFVFYIFSTVLLLSAAMVITVRNPVHSVLFLILTFFNAAALFILIGAEYIAMTLMIVYVGAVAVLFLFVVMMLDINIARIRQGFVSYLPLGATFAAVILTEIFFIIKASGEQASTTPVVESAFSTPEGVTNTDAIGRLLYTDFFLPFQIAGLILLVAMIGAIVLTHRKRGGVIRQSAVSQVLRTREQSVALVKVKSGEGV